LRLYDFISLKPSTGHRIGHQTTGARQNQTNYGTRDIVQTVNEDNCRFHDLQILFERVLENERPYERIHCGSTVIRIGNLDLRKQRKKLPLRFTNCE